ncbi:MAG TPA: heparan-alpha-glucosaminide N-acetyltransferase domain-containing protein [Candidatus Rifleibacterium sp.]|nr:heparan-alpha-glucosaminide N-acetyltransferase domain-containing protein [Candidatus Rifleibacterium sp.]
MICDSNVKPVQNSGSAQMNSAEDLRVAAFDHVRGLAVIFMIVSHVALMFGSAEAAATSIGRFMNDFCGTAPAAPVFMLLMGIFMIFPGEKRAGLLFCRGLKLFVLGLLLNIIRMVIPFFLLSIFIPGEFEHMCAMLQVSRGEVYWRIFYNVDILGFAGAACMLIAALSTVFKKAWHWVLAGSATIVAAPYLWGRGEGLGAFFYLLQPLWGRQFAEGVPTDTAFPVFPWLIFPILGLIIGRFLRDGLECTRLAGLLLRISLLTGSVGAALVWKYGMGQFGDYYRMYPGGTLLVVTFAALWTALFLWLAGFAWLRVKLDRLVFWSRHITLIYFVQWFIFGFSVLFLYFRRVDNPWVLVALTPLSLWLTWLLTRLCLASSSFMRFFRWFTH